jgi:hypothetical protein
VTHPASLIPDDDLAAVLAGSFPLDTWADKLDDAGHRWFEPVRDIARDGVFRERVSISLRNLDLPHARLPDGMGRERLRFPELHDPRRVPAASHVDQRERCVSCDFEVTARDLMQVLKIEQAARQRRKAPKVIEVNSQGQFVATERIEPGELVTIRGK